MSPELSNFHTFHKQETQRSSDISLTIWKAFKEHPQPCRFIFLTAQRFTVCCWIHSGWTIPCDSLKETLQLKWSIEFHGLYPNDWWHFLRHFPKTTSSKFGRLPKNRASPWTKNIKVMDSASSRSCYALTSASLLLFVQKIINLASHFALI